MDTTRHLSHAQLKPQQKKLSMIQFDSVLCLRTSASFRKRHVPPDFCPLGFNSLVGSILGFSILVSAEVFKHHPDVWFLDGTIGVLIGLLILAYGAK